MAGDSIADSVALKTANVGFCMGTGCDVAKDNSDLIINDNNFISIINAIKWGRAMFENSRKFIVFQFTVSYATLTTCLVSGLFLGNLPFNVIQLLWLNLIMDILAAISLGTGREQNKNPERISRKFKVFQPQMWRQIQVQAWFQIIIMLVLIFFGPMMFGYDYNLITADPLNKEKIKMDTFIFHTFFMLTMFNQICCRVIEEKEMNVFKTCCIKRRSKKCCFVLPGFLPVECSNPIFWFIWTIEMVIEHFMIMWSGTTSIGATVLGMSELPFEYLVIATIIGSLTFLVHIIQTRIPLRKFEEMDNRVAIDQPGAADKIENTFGKVKNFFSKSDENDDDDGEFDDNYQRMPEPNGSNKSIGMQP